MNKEMIMERVKDVISEQLSIAPDKISSGTMFTKDLGADSLDVFQFVTELENMFGIEFSNEDFEKIKTIGDAVKYIDERINR